MQLKKQLLQWYNQQLEDRNIYVTTCDELSSGYIFLQTLHHFHPKVIDLSRVYIKPKNQYQVLQNYKHLVNGFSKIGWKKFQPQRYAKKKEKDYLSLAQTMKKILSSRSIKQSRLQSNLDITLDQFKDKEEGKVETKDHFAINSKIGKLENTKKELLRKIGRVQECLATEIQGSNQQQISQLKLMLRTVLKQQPS